MKSSTKIKKIVLFEAYKNTPKCQHKSSNFCGNKDAYPMGDFNINLINFDSHNHTSQFLDEAAIQGTVLETLPLKENLFIKLKNIL